MKMNISLMKLTIRLLILMIFFVILFLILVVLYSTRYWPDIYNYINANITIKRIPTISELDITILEVDGTTEFYPTEDYVEASTMAGFDFDIDMFTNALDKEESKPIRAKRYAIEDFGKDYRKLPEEIVVDYLFVEDTSTIHEDLFVTKIIKDLINESKLVPKNYADVEIVDSLNEISSKKTSDITELSSVLSWVATIFVKNESMSNQFEYICDGALLSSRVLITAARCVMSKNATVAPEDVLVILGKRSLVSMADQEQTVKIKQITIHQNFTNENGRVDNDLVILEFEDPVTFNDIVQPANIGNDTTGVDKPFTFAWNPQGQLVPVNLKNKEAEACNSKNAGKHLFCAAYGLDVPLCPNYGGIYAGYQDETWQVLGLRFGDTTDRGLCFDKNVWFTDLAAYGDWIMEHLE